MMDYINAWLDKHYPKKFKLTVRRWHPWDTDLEIVYSYTRFKDKYQEIRTWDDVYGWRRIRYTTLSSALASIKEFDTLEKVQAHNNKHQAAYLEWKKEHPSEDIGII